MEKQPKNSGELSPEEQFDQDLNDVAEWYSGVVAAGKGKEALASFGVKSLDELNDDQISDLASKYRAGKEKQNADKAGGSSDKGEGNNAGPEGEAKKHEHHKKMGKATWVLASILGVTIAASAVGVGVTVLGKKGEDATDGGDNGLPNPPEHTIEYTIDNQDNQDTDNKAELKEAIEYNQHLYFNDPNKEAEHRSLDAICAAETVATHAFGDLDEESQKLLLEGRTEENAEAYDAACKKLLDRALVRNCEDSHQTTAAYAKRLIDKTDGDYFKKYDWEGLSQDEIEAKIDEMSDEEYAELMKYMGDIFDHATINGMEAYGDWSSHFQRDYDPVTGEALTNADGSQKIVNYDGGVQRNGAEETEYHLCKVDENGDFIEGEFYEKTQVVRANVEHLEVTKDEKGNVHIEMYDSKGNLLKYCLQFEDKGGKPDDEPGPVEENDPEPDPYDDGKNTDALNANGGNPGYAGVQGPADEQYDPGVPGGSSTPGDQGRGEGSTYGDVSKDAPAEGGDGESIEEVLAGADKTLDDEVTVDPGNGTTPPSDNQAREDEAHRNEATVTPPPASGANGGMTQQEEADYMSQYDGYGQQQA
ncbi:hypothetical protein J6X13_01470 [Candidatus Saccharibacteria bacterium]|nr:hypothetical protein [Candidatus Saccharibacteria bacterium]